MNNENQYEQNNVEPKPFEQQNGGRMAANNQPDDKEKKDHGPNLPEKDLEVKRPSSGQEIDPSHKQNEETQH